MDSTAAIEWWAKKFLPIRIPSWWPAGMIMTGWATVFTFWESSPQRALEFATQRARGDRNSRGDIRKPFVIGAVIDLGLCLNLVDVAAVNEIALAFRTVKANFEAAGEPLPVNIGGPDRLLRKLDCLVIETTHDLRERSRQPPYQTVRGIFTEGQPVYDGAGFDLKTHVQICVRDPDVIRGFFRPIEDSGVNRRRSGAN